MSQRDPSISSPTVEAVRLRAVEWLVERAEAEEWTAQNQQEFDAWLGEAPAHLLAFWRAEDSWNRAGLIAEFRTFAPRPEPKASRGWSGWVKGISAVAAAAVVAVGISRIGVEPAVKQYSTPIGRQKTLTLADGSRIDLNTDTILAVENNSPRSVTLVKGEAYFRIKHDAQHPFTVIAAGQRITDLGTAFTVRNSSARVVVALVEGTARVEDAKSSSSTRSATLKPGDVAIATAHSLSVTRAPLPELEAALSWRHGLLVFRHTTLAEAATEFNRYNQQKLVIEDASTARMELRGTFRANDAPAFARMTKAVMGVQVDYRGDDIVLHR